MQQSHVQTMCGGFVSNTQAYFWAHQKIIRDLQCKIHLIQDIINQLRQEVDPNLLIIEEAPIFDNNKAVQFCFPPALLAQETRSNTQQTPNLQEQALILMHHGRITVSSGQSDG